MSSNFDNNINNDKPSKSSRFLRVKQKKLGKSSNISHSLFFMFFICSMCFCFSSCFFFPILLFSIHFSMCLFFCFFLFFGRCERKENRRKVPSVKMAIFPSENSILGPRCTGEGPCFHVFSFFHVSLLALVSEFNFRCFLRDRCSMEIWFPDDMGRESWGWVGPPSWERA